MYYEKEINNLLAAGAFEQMVTNMAMLLLKTIFAGGFQRGATDEDEERGEGEKDGELPNPKRIRVQVKETMINDQMLKCMRIYSSNAFT